MHHAIPAARMSLTPGYAGCCSRLLQILMLSFACLCCTKLLALDPNRNITQLAHRSWGETDGAPSGPSALAQTKDGYLWIGTFHGLYRFDGRNFELYRPISGSLPSQLIESLLATEDGKLWIGFGGFISELSGGRITTYGGKDSLLSADVRGLAKDKDGAIWAATGHGVRRFDGRHWEDIGIAWNCPEAPAGSLLVDRDGTLWVSVGQTILYLQRGSRRFAATGEFALVTRQMAQAPDGRIWIADTGMAVRPIGMPGSRRHAISQCLASVQRNARFLDAHTCQAASVLQIEVGSSGLLFDRMGSLWITTLGDGIRRAPFPARLKDHGIGQFSREVEVFTNKEGLSADFSYPILEDREGNIWIGTRDGLDQFRDTKLVPVLFPSSNCCFSLTPGDEGYVWVSSYHGTVAHIHGEESRSPLMWFGADRGYHDPQGNIWFLGDNQLYRVSDASFIKNPKPPELASQANDPFLAGSRKPVNGRFEDIAALPKGLVKTALRLYRAMSGDDSGRLWAFGEGSGLFSLEGKRWKHFETPQKIARLTPVTAFTDSTGRIWFGTGQGLIVTLFKGKLVSYSEVDGLSVGAVAAVFARDGHTWAAGTKGLALFDGKRFRSVRPTDAESFHSISGVVEIADDGLWVNEARGVLHIPNQEMRRSLLDPGYRPRYELLNASDGLPGVTQQVNPWPTATQGTDGRLWFATSRGVAWVDPKHLTANTLPPPVSIESVSAGGIPYDLHGVARIPARTTSVEIRYAGLSLAVPERVRFRYRLDGVDTDWQQVDTRRVAYYTNLGPGSYTFHVIACNNDGIWNETGATGHFYIAPAYYQTWWFRLLYIALAIGALWLFYLYRLRLATAQIQERLGVRMEERERIARELHDTLLQGFHGLMLRFHAVLKTLPADGPAREMVEKALDRADEVLIEGRQRVQDLRLEGMTGYELPDHLRKCGEELAQDYAIAFSLSVIGTPQELNPIVCTEAYLVVREALANAFMHSHGSKIEAELTYEPTRLCLRVRDDGDGMDKGILVSGRSGHWGILGMRERAQKIGAQLDLITRPTSGTEVQLTIPATLAYERGGRLVLSRLIIAFGSKRKGGV